jgi:hypothetical protein
MWHRIADTKPISRILNWLGEGTCSYFRQQNSQEMTRILFTVDPDVFYEELELMRSFTASTHTLYTLKSAKRDKDLRKTP